MHYIGDFKAGVTLGRKFPTHKADGTPITLSGTQAVKVYKNGSPTESAAGVTLTVDYDAVTGLNDVSIDTSADGAFYAAGNDFTAFLSAGTVDGVSVVGATLFDFSIENRNIDANLVKQNGVAVLNYQFGVQSATGTTVKIATTYADTSSLPNDFRYEYTEIEVVDGTGAGQNVVFTTRTGTANEYNVLSGTMPVLLDATSKCNALGSVRVKTDFPVVVGTNNDKGNYILETTFVATMVASVVAGVPTAIQIADAHLDRVDGIETGITPRKTLRGIVAALAGQNTGSGTGTEIFKAAGNPGTTRTTYTIDANGNRSSVILNW